MEKGRTKKNILLLALNVSTLVSFIYAILSNSNNYTFCIAISVTSAFLTLSDFVSVFCKYNKTIKGASERAIILKKYELTSQQGLWNLYQDGILIISKVNFASATIKYNESEKKFDVFWIQKQEKVTVDEEAIETIKTMIKNAHAFKIEAYDELKEKGLLNV